MLKRGKSYWKFNAALLQDISYLNFVNEEIDNFMQLDIEDPIDRFESFKIFIKSKTISFSIKRNKDNNMKFIKIQANINSINTKLIKDPGNQNLIENLFKAKKELEVLELEKAKGAMVRAKMKEVTMGEKNTQYFLGVEKGRGNDNTIYKLNTEEGELTDQEVILGEITRHFEKLYSKDKDIKNDNLNGIQDFLRDIPHNKISDIDKQMLEEQISMKEIGEALFDLSNDASPGIDGIPACWYKAFYGKIKHMLFECLEKTIENGEMGVSQRQGVISLLY